MLKPCGQSFYATPVAPKPQSNRVPAQIAAENQAGQHGRATIRLGADCRGFLHLKPFVVIIIADGDMKVLGISMAMALQQRGFPDAIHIPSTHDAAAEACARRASFVVFIPFDEGYDEAARRVLRDCPGCKIIFFCSTEWKAEFLKEKFGDKAIYLLMPVSPPDLAAFFLREAPAGG
jgi:hypothetical protein